LRPRGQLELLLAKGLTPVKHRVLVVVCRLPRSGFVAVVSANQLPIERFIGPGVTPMAGQHGVMDSQSVLPLPPYF
jgi:hypothetical protein